MKERDEDEDIDMIDESNSNSNVNDSKISALEIEENVNSESLAIYKSLLESSKKDNPLSDFFLKDPSLDIGYILTNPLIILNSKDYTTYGQIKIKDEHISLINNQKFSGFIYENSFYIILYDQNNFFLYSLANTNPNDDLHHFQINKDENVINVKFLPNDNEKVYFIIITDSYTLYILNINFQNGNMNYNFQLIHDKNSQSILAKSFSVLWPFNSMVSNENIKYGKIFIINPFINRWLKKNSNVVNYNNCIYSLSTSNNNFILKKICFNLSRNTIDAQIDNTKDITKNIYDTLYYSDNSNIKYNINIISVDSYFNEISKTIQIYCYLNYGKNKYVFRISINDNFYMNYNYFLIDGLKESEYSNRGKISVNKYIDEGILVIPNEQILNFHYYTDDKNISSNNKKGWKFSSDFNKNIIGINIFNQPSIFSIDVFTLENVVNFNFILYYTSPSDIDGKYKQSKTDRTEYFLYNLSRNNLINNTYNTSLNINNSNNNSFTVHNSMKPYEILLNNEKRKQFQNLLDEAIKKRLGGNSYLTDINEADKYIINNIEKYFSSNEKNTLEDLVDYIKDIINNDSTHIEIIEKSNTKAKLLTVKYLEEKYEKLMIIFNLISNVTIGNLNIFDHYPDLLNEFYKIFEKIIIGINIRKEENNHYEKIEKNKYDYNNSGNIKLINLFIETFYNEIKKYKFDDNSNFNHLLLFGKISNIDKYLLDTFFKCFNIIYNLNSDLKQEKDELILFILQIIIGINKDIEELLNKIVRDKKYKQSLIKYKGGLWYLNDKNLLCKNYLISLLNLIDEWKMNEYPESKINDDIIFIYGEQLQFLCKEYLIYGNNSTKDKFEYINCIKIIDTILMKYDIDRTYKLCKKYLDHITLAAIAFSNKNKYYSDLKNFMNNTLKNKRAHIKNILLQILKLELKEIQLSKDEFFNPEFNFFEEFDEFIDEIYEISKTNPKFLKFLNLYLLQKDIKTNTNERNCELNDIIYNIDNKNEIENIDYLIKILNINKGINIVKSSFFQNDLKKEEINEENILYLIGIICEKLHYKNLLNQNTKNIYEKIMKFVSDYFNNFIQDKADPDELKKKSYFVLFILNECIKSKKINIDKANAFICTIIHKCLYIDNDFIYKELSGISENNNQKMNLIYRLAAEKSIIVKMYQCFKELNPVFIDKINRIKEDELNLEEEIRTNHLIEFISVVMNIFKKEKDEINNVKNNIDIEDDEELIG